MFVYVIQSKFDNSHYVGMSSNLGNRLQEHNRKKVRSTRSKIPWVIIYQEEVDNREHARIREKYLKSAAGRRFRKSLSY